MTDSTCFASICWGDSREAKASGFTSIRSFVMAHVSLNKCLDGLLTLSLRLHTTDIIRACKRLVISQSSHALESRSKNPGLFEIVLMDAFVGFLEICHSVHISASDATRASTEFMSTRQALI